MRLRKFNESSNSIDLDYVKECLIDIIDDGFKVEIDNDLDDYGKIEPNNVNIRIYQYSIMNNRGFYNEEKTISELLNGFDRINEMLKDLEVGIDKIKIKYTDMSSRIWLEPAKINIRLNI